MRALVVAWLLTASGLVLSASPIVIDGELADWVEPPQRVDDDDAARINLRSLTTAHDADSVFIRLDLEQEVNLQALPGSMLSLLFDADHDPGTGRKVHGLDGVDLIVDFTPPQGKPSAPGYGVAIRYPKISTRERQSAYQQGIAMAPTHSARSFEIRLERFRDGADEIRLFDAPAFTVKAVLTDSRNRVVDDMQAVSHSMQSGGRPSPPAAPSSALSRQGTDILRIISWNVADSRFQRHAEVFARILGVLQADVMLLDEAPSGVTADALRGLLTKAGMATAGEPWQILIGRGGGRQRGVIISRLPLSEVPEFEHVRYSRGVIDFIQSQGTRRMREDLGNTRQEGMPIAAAEIQWQGRRLLVGVMDLQCCGYAGSAEDRFRVMQVKTVRAAMALALNNRPPPHGIYLAGDLNLVGSRVPLDELMRRADLDGSDLAVADTRQLDGRSNASYGFRGPFLPGQLDFAVYSDASLIQRSGFVFDSRDLDPTVRTNLGIRATDSQTASDHMPVVVDVHWRDVPPGAARHTRSER